MLYFTKWLIVLTWRKNMNLGTPELIIVLVIVLVLFGGSRIGKLGGEMGEAISNFRKGMREAEDADEAAEKEKEETT
jgi:sec-independent protein translocase protein TatA